MGQLDIAVNNTGNPTGLWKSTRSTPPTTATAANLPAAPASATSRAWASTRQHLRLDRRVLDPRTASINGGQIYAIAKSDLLAGELVRALRALRQPVQGGALSRLHPAGPVQRSAERRVLPEPARPERKVDNRIGVWALTHRDRVATGGTPTLSKKVITSEPYGKPPGAAQKGANSTMDTGDDRMQQVSSVGGTVWGELGTGLSATGGSSNRAAAAWFQVSPPSPAPNWVARRFCVRAIWPIPPAHCSIRPSSPTPPATPRWSSPHGPNQYPSVGYSRLSSGGSAFTTPAVAAAGTGPYAKDSTRWGDYSFAVPDPTSDAAWLASEYIPPVASQTTDHEQNWGTAVLHVRLG